mgnify:CR=1 FL=1
MQDEKFYDLLESPRIKRDIKSRTINKEKNRILASKFDRDYFDGSRETGYGGYKYDGRWIPIAKKIIKKFNLKENDKFLDVGCAKGFLMHDINNLSSGKINVHGIEISDYAINLSMPSIKNKIIKGNCKKLPFGDKEFNFTCAINTIHNLELADCIEAIKEIQRVSKQSFIQVDAYRNKAEYDIFIDWMLTAKTFLMPQEWKKLFRKCNYSGYYFWTILEV